MDAFLAVVSKRDVRRYDSRPLPEDVVRRILEAGRIAGSARNRQNRRFVVLGDREAAADAVYQPENVRGAALAVAVVVGGKGPIGFDAGRAAQNMMLVAWNEGIGSCPNGPADSERLNALAGVEPGEEVVNVLSFGYPDRTRDPARRSTQEWIEQADRKSFDETVDLRDETRRGNTVDRWRQQRSSLPAAAAARILVVRVRRPQPGSGERGPPESGVFSCTGTNAGARAAARTPTAPAPSAPRRRARSGPAPTRCAAEQARAARARRGEATRLRLTDRSSAAAPRSRRAGRRPGRRVAITTPAVVRWSPGWATSRSSATATMMIPAMIGRCR